MSNCKPRVFMGFVEIAGYYTNLQKGFDQLGIKSTFASLSESVFKYEAERSNSCIARSFKFWRIQRVKTPKTQFFKKITAVFMDIFSTSFFFISIALKHDVFIFGFNSTFFKYYDLPVLKILGKKIIYVFHGSDSRPPYINGKFEDLEAEELICYTQRQKEILRKIAKYADLIIDTPTGAHFHEKRIIIHQKLGLPFKAAEECVLIEKNGLSGEVCIVHAPSHAATKGTALVRVAIEKLKEKGHLIKYVELIGQPNAVVLSELQKCDFVVDELYSDIIMAGFSTEAAFFSKPAIVGGYGYEPLKNVLGNQNIPPVQHCQSEEVQDAIEKLIVDKEYRLALGRKAYEYVRQYCSPTLVAYNFIRLIKGDIPDGWYYDPKNIKYLHGYGLSEQRAKRMIHKLLDKGGEEALELSDKPELRQMFVHFATLNSRRN